LQSSADTSSTGESGGILNGEDIDYDEENEYIIVNRILERAAAAAA